MGTNDPGSTPLSPDAPPPGFGPLPDPGGPAGPYGPYGPLPEFARGQRRAVVTVPEIPGPMGRWPRRRRRRGGCCGCFGLLFVLLVVLAAVYTLPNPWALNIGDRFTPTESWQGYGAVQASNGGHYELYLDLRGGVFNSGSGGHLGCDSDGCDSLSGTGRICGAAGEVYTLNVSGSVKSWWSTDGAAADVDLTNSPPLPSGWVIALHGAWHGRALELHSPDNSWTDVFTPRGKIRFVTSTADSGTAATTIRYGSETAFDTACQRLAS